MSIVYHIQKKCACASEYFARVQDQCISHSTKKKKKTNCDSHLLSYQSSNKTYLLPLIKGWSCNSQQDFFALCFIIILKSIVNCYNWAIVLNQWTIPFDVALQLYVNCKLSVFCKYTETCLIMLWNVSFWMFSTQLDVIT